MSRCGITRSISDSCNVDKLAEECSDTEILISNAVAIPGGNIDAVDETRWRAAWDLKVFSYVNMTRRFYALMRERKKGVIINIIGAAGENPDFDYVAGSSGNASLTAFTRAIGGTAPRDGLRVLGINPGPVLTDRLVTLMRTRAQTQFGGAERWTEYMKPLAFGRAAKPEEIAWMAAFLASDLSGYTTGPIVTIDGRGSSRRLGALGSFACSVLSARRGFSEKGALEDAAAQCAQQCVIISHRGETAAPAAAATNST
jgi:NAD(P)-dependent dehydrogenase (short-subunit alcohol dehydrogenase family)